MEKSFSIVMKEIFLKPGQSMSDFMAELKQLNADDKKWYYDALIKEGYKPLPPQAIAATQ